MLTKSVANVLFLLTNIAVFLFAVISDSINGTSAPSVVAQNQGVFDYLRGVLALIPFAIIMFGQSLVFYFSAKRTAKNPDLVFFFVALNIASAVFCSYQFVVQTDSSRIFFFAIHWAASWIISIVASAITCSIYKDAA